MNMAKYLPVIPITTIAVSFRPPVSVAVANIVTVVV